MDQETLDLLEFDRVLQIIEDEAESPEGKALICAMHPFSDPARAAVQLRQIEEASAYTTQKRRLSCGHLGDLQPVLDSLRIKSSLLTSSELLSVFRLLRFASDAKKALEPSKWPSLSMLLCEPAVPIELQGRLSEAIDEKGEIRETAFPELAKARREQIRFREKTQEHLTRYQQGPKARYLVAEPYITQRAGRYVIPVRVEHQRQIPGIVHGTSSSGAAVFLEPFSAVELNNQYIYYRDRENEIVRHILAELTQTARTHLGTLLKLLKQVALVDAIFSCAAFSLRFGCSSPELGVDREMKILGARHPLLTHTLGAEKVVPLSVELDSRKNVLVISGPNNGGKTVALKTVGLLAVMGQAGLPVPAEEAHLPILKNVLADIGDHQSIIQQLSTFSSHIKRVNTLLTELRVPCLLLLDEIGRGTDPTYGAALAVSIIEHLRSRETLVIATTHHHAVKAYASSSRGVRNASVRLDSLTLKPSYVLEFGVAGSSSGLEIAEQLGMNEEIVAHARALLDTRELQVEAYLKQLRKELQLVEERNRNVSAELEQLEKRKVKLEKEAAERESRRSKEFERLLKKWAAEFQSESSRCVRQLKDRFAAAKAKEEAKRREAALKEAFRRKLRASQNDQSRPETPDPIAVGDTVLHSVFEKRGLVLSLDQKEALVEIAGKKISVPLSRLRKVQSGQMIRKPSDRVILNVVETSDPELNLIGMTVEQATEVLDKFLDRAFVSGLKEVRIIHGFGTGKLRSAVSRLLEGHPQVHEFRADGGATKVTLSQ